MTANARRALSVTLLVTAGLTTACVTATKNITPQVERATEDRSVVEPDDAIAIVPEGGVRCISKSLRQVQPDLRIVPPDEFRHLAFPDETGDRISFAYPIPEALRQVLSTQAFRERIAPFHLRYLVSIGEVDRSRDATGNACAVFGALFCYWYNSLTLIASAVDLKDGRDVGRIVVDAKGERVVFIFLVLPFFYVETTHGPACKALGETLANFLRGRFPYASQRTPERGR